MRKSRLPEIVRKRRYNVVQRTDGTFLIVPRFLAAGVVTKWFQLKVKRNREKQAVSYAWCQ